MPKPVRYDLVVSTRLEAGHDSEEFVRRCLAEGKSPSELARELIHAGLAA